MTLLETWPLAAILFVPLVILAWQHSLRSVVVFCLGTALLDLSLAILAARGDSFYFFSTAHSILTRTLLFLLVGYMVSRIMAIQRQQRQSLAETINACCAAENIDCVVDASPARLDRMMEIDVPLVRVAYRFKQIEGEPLEEMVLKVC